MTSQFKLHGTVFVVMYDDNPVAVKNERVEAEELARTLFKHRFPDYACNEQRDSKVTRFSPTLHLYAPIVVVQFGIDAPENDQAAIQTAIRQGGIKEHGQ